MVTSSNFKILNLWIQSHCKKIKSLAQKEQKLLDFHFLLILWGIDLHKCPIVFYQYDLGGWNFRKMSVPKFNLMIKSAGMWLFFYLFQVSEKVTFWPGCVSWYRKQKNAIFFKCSKNSLFSLERILYEIKPIQKFFHMSKCISF